MHGYWPLLLQILRVAGASTLVSLAAGLWLGHRSPRHRASAAIGSFALMLPPTVIGAYLLLPVFTEPLAVAAAVLRELPVLARSARGAFGSLPPDYANAARSTGASEWRIFRSITLPLAFRPVLAESGIELARVAAEYALVLWMARGLRPHP